MIKDVQRSGRLEHTRYLASTSELFHGVHPIEHLRFVQFSPISQTSLCTTVFPAAVVICWNICLPDDHTKLH